MATDVKQYYGSRLIEYTHRELYDIIQSTESIQSHCVNRETTDVCSKGL